MWPWAFCRKVKLMEAKIRGALSNFTLIPASPTWIHGLDWSKDDLKYVNIHMCSRLGFYLLKRETLGKMKERLSLSKAGMERSVSHKMDWDSRVRFPPQKYNRVATQNNRNKNNHFTVRWKDSKPIFSLCWQLPKARLRERGRCLGRECFHFS